MKRLAWLVPVVFVNLFLIVSTAVAQPLRDITGHWAERSIRQLVDASIIGGFPDGSFRPDSYMTREEFIK